MCTGTGTPGTGIAGSLFMYHLFMYESMCLCSYLKIYDVLYVQISKEMKCSEKLRYENAVCLLPSCLTVIC